MEVVVVKKEQLPVLVEMPLDLSLENILRRQEVPPNARVQPRVAETLKGLLESIHDLLQPAVAFASYPVAEALPDRFCLANGDLFHIPKVVPILSKAK
jgi:hypothetical protein